jgi:hypothetical protein
MVLAAKLGLQSVQCDIAAAFIHSHVPPEREIYVHNLVVSNKARVQRSFPFGTLSMGFVSSHFTERLVKQGLTPSNFDPCLFLSSTLIVIIYVDDILIYGQDEKEIDNFIARMKTQDMALHKEGTAEGYLEVDIQRYESQITFTQIGLIKCIIDALGLDSKFATAVATPAEKEALGRDVDGPPASGQVNYASVIGILLYLGHSRPDIAFATHQCAGYTFAPKQLHEDALKRIGCYLKGTLDKGLILRSSDDFKNDCYPDADLAGLWNRNNKNDPHCVQSWTGYVRCVSHCPVLWTSKLQTEIALSMMEAEYVALS